MLADNDDGMLSKLQLKSTCDDKKTKEWCSNVIEQCTCSCSQFDVVRFASDGMLFWMKLIFII